MEQACKKTRNITTAFIDYQKAYDSVPHSWLKRVLQIYQIHPQIMSILERVMMGWRGRVRGSVRRNVQPHRSSLPSHVALLRIQFPLFFSSRPCFNISSWWSVYVCVGSKLVLHDYRVVIFYWFLMFFHRWFFFPLFLFPSFSPTIVYNVHGRWASMVNEKCLNYHFTIAGELGKLKSSCTVHKTGYFLCLLSPTFSNSCRNSYVSKVFLR